MDAALRIPVINIRYIDASILLFLLVFFKDLFQKIYFKKNGKLTLIQKLIILYLIFEIYNFFRSLNVRNEDFNSTFGMLLISLTIIILFELSETKINVNNLSFLSNFIIIASIILSIDSIATLLGLTYGFSTVDSLGRVMLDPTGFKNTISNVTLLTIVVSYSVKYRNLNFSIKRKFILITGLIILSISLVLSFHRGTLFVWIFSILFVIFEGKGSTRLKNFLIITVVAIFLFSIIGDYLSILGFNPLTKLEEIFQFSTDINRPGWDKGRAWAQAQALELWKDDIFWGKGYLNYFEYNAATPHNFFITSLVTRGLIGTIIIVLIISAAYYKSVLLWRQIRNLTIREKTMIRSLIFASWLFLIGMMTQEAFTERYCLSVQYIYWGLICGLYNFYSQDKNQIQKV